MAEATQNEVVTTVPDAVLETLRQEYGDHEEGELLRLALHDWLNLQSSANGPELNKLLSV